MKFPDDLRYSLSHEWLRQDGDTVVVGITHFAVDQLGDVTFVELPEVGTSLEKGDAFGVIESTKSTTDLLAPISGEVVATHSDLEDKLDLLKESPYEKAWLIKLRLRDPGEIDTLLTADAYAEHTESETH